MKTKTIGKFGCKICEMQAKSSWNKRPEIKIVSDDRSIIAACKYVLGYSKPRG